MRGNCAMIIINNCIIIVFIAKKPSVFNSHIRKTIYKRTVLEKTILRNGVLDMIAWVTRVTCKGG